MSYHQILYPPNPLPSRYVTEVDVEIARRAIRAIGTIAVWESNGAHGG